MWALRRSASGAPILLLSLPLLGVARLLPAHGFGLWLRLVAASLVLLLPGTLVARALRLRGASATVAWGLGALGPALLLVFVVHGSILLALAILGVVGVVALPFALRVVSGPPAWDTLAIAFLGLAFGVALWQVAGVVTGDALFHLGRVQKLYSFGDLRVRSVDEFKDGGLHPGYAFPLWHAFLALVAKVGGVGPTQVMLHEPSAIAPVAFAVVYEAGLALFRSVWLGGAVLTAAVSAVALAPGHGGSFALLSQPGTLDRYVLVAAALTLFFLFLRHPGWVLGLSLAAIGVEVLLVHTSTAVFLGVPLLGFAGARVLLTRTDLRSSATALAALFLPAAAALAWLLPLVRETASHSPSSAELQRALTKYADELNVDSLHHYALRPEVVSRGGAVAVAALVVVPLAAFAARQRWAAFVLGGTLAVLGIELLPWLFPHFADAISVSQARRLAGFVPIPFALAGGAAVLAGMVGPLVLPVALGAGIALQLAFSGADLKAVVSYHGALPTPNAADVKQTKATILVCHGADDSFIPEAAIKSFRDALDKGHACLRRERKGSRRRGSAVNRSGGIERQAWRQRAGTDRPSITGDAARCAQRLRVRRAHYCRGKRTGCNQKRRTANLNREGSRCARAGAG